MAYSIPELLLVGAAQNIVLEGSAALPGVKTLGNASCKVTFPNDDDTPDSYQSRDEW